MRERERQYETFVAALIIEGQQQGCFDASIDPASAVDSTLGMLTTVYRWSHPADASEEHTQTVIEHTAGMVLRGLGGTCTHQTRLTGRSA